MGLRKRGKLKKYRVAQVGCGERGKVHIKGFLANKDRFEYVGLCDLDGNKLKDAAKKFDVKVSLYKDAENMLAETMPDIFCFVTPPKIRLELVKLGAKYNVSGMLIEKPMATSLKEANEIRDLCFEKGIKLTVCHQHKYLPSMRKLKSIVESEEIGKIKKIHVNTRAWIAELGTHYMDYALWAAGCVKAKWVAGHVHGKGKLKSNHPSPDNGNAVILLDNGARIYFECGYLSEQNLTDDEFWLDDRITIYGEDGFVWAEANGAWKAITPNKKIEKGQYLGWVEYMDYMQAAYIKDFTKWMDDESCVHPCNVETSYHGYEILEAIYLSSLNNTRIDLPIDKFNYSNLLERMEAEFSEIETYIPNAKLCY